MLLFGKMFQLKNRKKVKNRLSSVYSRKKYFEFNLLTKKEATLNFKFMCIDLSYKNNSSIFFSLFQFQFSDSLL